ncbi:MAG: M20/M25/M40 family metallo-hydrolase [Chloroflexi bacterium]|nr:MAG: M20/M25/M40 family metallo-hydrolase [Chloroflexota bacterium]
MNNFREYFYRGESGVNEPSNIYQRPAELLQKLIRFDTTNPPGNERACVQFIDGLLQDAGIETTILAKEDNRLNLIARLKGNGTAPPLLMQGHVDVVTTVGQQWQHDPFGGELIDGYVWGRGALDMKGGVAMMVAAFLRAKAEQANLPGDVILTILADEENSGTFGAKYLVEAHPEQFEGVKYALGEFGGFTLSLAGKRFYPIMIAEKQICWMKMIVRGPGGHGSLPMRDGAMARLGQLLQKLNHTRLPAHITPAVRMMFAGIANAVSFPTNSVLKFMLNSSMTNRMIEMLGERGKIFDPLLHNTVNATIVHGGHKVNVIPSEVELQLDGRLLPGFTPDDMIAELRPIVGDDIDIEVVEFDPGPPEPDMALFETLGGILKEADPNGIPVPLILPGVTDARFFAQLGIQTYGFLPMQLPDDFTFNQLIHAANERIPAAAVEFGANAIYQALNRF